MVLKTGLALLAVATASIATAAAPAADARPVSNTSAAQAARTYRITKASAATNAKVARETAYEFSTDGRPVRFSYRTGAVLKLPHRLSDGTIKVWAGVTRSTKRRAARLVLADGGYYRGFHPHEFDWALADSGSAPRDPDLTRGELAALTHAVGWRHR